MITLNSTSRIIEQSQAQSAKKFFLKIDEEYLNSNTNISTNTSDDLKIRITICDGKNVWESSKIPWNDLIKLKPDGIEDSLQNNLTRCALYGDHGRDSKCLGEGMVSEDDEILLEFKENSTGNLNVSWKLKQSLGITIVLGAIILLKVPDSDTSQRIIEILELAVSTSSLSLQLKESLELNKQLVEELDKVVQEKLAGEEDLYTKFRILLNKCKARE